MTDTALVVFSHLRWDFVYQRPQHILSRMRIERPILYIEEPVHDAGAPRWDFATTPEGVLVCTPRTPAKEPGYSDAQLVWLIPLLRELVGKHLPARYAAWLYTPMAVPLLQQLSPTAVVYDCMDELAGFMGAPSEIAVRERELLQAADIVFTGGVSLYRAKQHRHHNVHCFPSSVDAAHFRRARIETEPADQCQIARPRLGFFGVIDERLDRELLAALATSHPEWQIVLVGPIVKIDPATLPRHANIHYLGQRAYKDLPAYLSGWQLCLLPFAQNEATRFISPTKTLEYMAAEIPIVSTPICDVAEPYSEIVYLGGTPAEFIAACERALGSSPQERNERTRRLRAVLAKTSWDTTVQAMAAVLSDAERKRAATMAPTTVAPGDKVAERASSCQPLS